MPRLAINFSVTVKWVWDLQSLFKGIPPFFLTLKATTAATDNNWSICLHHLKDEKINGHKDWN